MTTRVTIVSDVLKPFDVLADAASRLDLTRCGATATFTGTVRAHDTSTPLVSLELEHYPGMTEREIESVCIECARRWNTAHIEVCHRVGRVFPGDPIVVIGVWAEHRASAFDACRALITYLKERAPIWKRENYASTSRWVDSNTVDPGAA